MTEGPSQSEMLSLLEKFDLHSGETVSLFSTDSRRSILDSLRHSPQTLLLSAISDTGQDSCSLLGPGSALRRTPSLPSISGNVPSIVNNQPLAAVPRTNRGGRSLASTMQDASDRTSSATPTSDAQARSVTGHERWQVETDPESPDRSLAIGGNAPAMPGSADPLPEATASRPGLRAALAFAKSAFSRGDEGKAPKCHRRTRSSDMLKDNVTQWGSLTRCTSETLCSSPRSTSEADVSELETTPHHSPQPQ